MQRLEIIDIAMRLHAVDEHGLCDQLVHAKHAEPGNFVEVILRMILDRPEGATVMIDGDGLHPGEVVGSEQFALRRDQCDLVGMAGKSIELRWLAGEQRMCSSLRCETKPAGDAEFAALRVRCTTSTGCNTGNLRSPTAAEAWNTGPIDGTRELDLAPDPFVTGVVDRKARPGPDDPIVLFNGHAVRQHGIGIGGTEAVDPTIGCKLGKEALVQIAGERGLGSLQAVAALTGVGIEYQDDHEVVVQKQPLSRNTPPARKRSEKRQQ